MNNVEIKNSIYSKIEQLPTLPSMIPELLGSIDIAKSSVSEVADVIAKDPSLSFNILRVANSAYYGFSGKIFELDRAVTLIGFKMVRTLSQSIEEVTNIAQYNSECGFSLDKIWKYSYIVALTMKEIARKFFKRRDIDRLFMVGLLHQLGVIVLSQYFTESFKKIILETGAVFYDNIISPELKNYKIDHGEIGAILLERWNFPKEIIEPIKLQYADNIDDQNKRDIYCLKLAKELCKELLDISEPNINMAELDYLKIADEDLAMLKKKIISFLDF